MKWQRFVCLPLIAILPASLLADDATAMLRSNGIGVLVNKNPAPASVALYSGDLIEAQENSVARIEASGSTANINPGTIVQFDGDELVLDHGSLSVSTSRGLKVRVGCLIVTPVHDAAWTQYDVADVNGRVTVSALKDDVNIDSRSSHRQSSDPRQASQGGRSDQVTVREGEQKSREEKCGAADIKEPGAVAGKGAILNSPWARGAGMATIVGLTCWALCQSGNPISPSWP